MTELRALDDERKRLLQGVAVVDAKMRALLAKLAGSRPPVVADGAQTAPTGETGEKGTRLLQILAENPRLDVKRTAQEIYGGDGREECARVRALLRHLKKMGRVESTERSVWQPTVHFSSVAEPEVEKAPVVGGAPRAVSFKIPNRTPNGAAR